MSSPFHGENHGFESRTEYKKLTNMYKILLALFLVLSFFITYRNMRLSKENKYLVRIKDSLNSEVFVREIQLQRYEYIVEGLDSSCSKNFDSLMSVSE